MIDAYGPLIAWALLAISLVSLILFAFAGASKRADDAADQLIDGIAHGDVPHLPHQPRGE